MESNIAIRIEHLGKRYKIGGGPGFDTLRDAITGGVSRIFRRAPRAKREEFWALKDVTFEVEKGEVVGIIGRNGAGKSTLLKILSRITETTEGRARVRGRVRALLEVGTGFHGELTGRENIYVSGAILGMRKAEIDGKFDKIVDFSGVEKFLDTPVKHYSSGMYVRLGFAVAAHLEPEVLLVDEVLAVGDAEFQKRCLGKMDEVAKGGRTVLFVSHNMGAIRALCRRAVWIDGGTSRRAGEASDVVDSYIKGLTEEQEYEKSKQEQAFFVKKVLLKNSRGEISNKISFREDLEIEVHYIAKNEIRNPRFWLFVIGPHGPLFSANMRLDGFRPHKVQGEGSFSCIFKQVPLLPQLYTIRMGAQYEDGVSTLLEDVNIASFYVNSKMSELGLTGALADVLAARATSIMNDYEWRFPDQEPRAISAKKDIAS